ncbi:MAG: serine/threonine-protein kinase, partial [Myxococcota bacterium]
MAALPDGGAAAGGLAPGSTLGRYQIVAELAMGGMAELYIGRHTTGTGYKKVVAIKRVLPNLSRDEAFVRMFLNEARLAAGLDHGNIVHVVDFGTDGREHFLAMEYVHGRGVHQILRAAAKVGGVPIACALTIVRGIADALHYAHERKSGDGRPLGLVHRDVSPSNILVSYEGEVKLADFGIATATELTRATRTGSIKGKLSYMAPEQVRGEEVDRRADVFSLGAVLYELTTGSRCFYAPGEFALINRVVEGRYDKPTSIRPTFPPALEAIIERALQVDRDERYETARQMQVALEAFATGAGLSLSSVEVSTLMGQLFGYQEYPNTDVLPDPTADSAALVPMVERTVETTGAARRRRRRATPALLVAGGIGVAVGLGGGVAVSLGGDSEPATVDSVAPAVPASV